MLGAVDTLRAKATSLAAGANAGRDEWLKRAAQFDDAVTRIDGLEDSKHTKAAAFRKVSDAIQSRVDGGDFQQATTAFDHLQPKLNDIITQPNGPTSGLDGLDSGRVQAFNPAPFVGPAKQVAKKAWDWINEQGLTTIIIENHSSKALSRLDGLEGRAHPKDATWVKKAPPEIPAAKGGTPGKATITIKTDKLWRGKTTAVTSGWVAYEIVGEDKKATVRIAWVRKGAGQLDEKESWTESGRYEIRGFQSNEGEFTFRFTENQPAAKPNDPQPPKAPATKEPQSGGGKDPTSAAPGDTHVLFEQGKFKLTSETKSRLHTFALAYLASKSAAKIKLEGYASKEGQEASNRTLSFDRAEAVFNFLVDIEKLPRDRVEWHGHGVTSDFDPKKLEPNRRVTIKVL